MICALPAIILLFILVYFLERFGKQMSAGERVFTIAAILLLVGFLIQYLFDPLAPYRNQRELNKLQRELNAAEKKWNSQNITDFSIEMEYYSPAALGGCGAIITVRKGEVVEVVETQRGGWEKLPEPRVLPESMWDDDWWEDDHCHYSRFTIPEAFEDVQNGINAGEAVDASFDPKFGFVTEYRIDQNISYAPLRGSVTESSYGCTFSNFHRLDPSTP